MIPDSRQTKLHTVLELKTSKAEQCQEMTLKNKDMAIRGFFCRPLLRFLSFSQWCLLPHRLTVVITKDVSCIFCCFQYGLPHSGFFACHDFHHHCITIVAFFKINVIGVPCFRRCYLKGTIFPHVCKPYQFSPFRKATTSFQVPSQTAARCFKGKNNDA